MSYHQAGWPIGYSKATKFAGSVAHVELQDAVLRATGERERPGAVLAERQHRVLPGGEAERAAGRRRQPDNANLRCRIDHFDHTI